MFVVTVTFVLKPRCFDTFLPLMIYNARRSLDVEPGCRQFDVCVGDDKSVFLYELYDDPEAFEDHLRSEHFVTFDEAVRGMIENKTVQQFNRVLQ